MLRQGENPPSFFSLKRILCLYYSSIASPSVATLFEFIRWTADNITVSACLQIGGICIVFMFLRNMMFLSGRKNILKKWRETECWSDHKKLTK